MKFYENGGSARTYTIGTETAAITVDDGAGTAVAMFGTANTADVMGLLVDSYDSTLATHKMQGFITDVASSTTVTVTPTWVASNGVTAGADNDVFFVVGEAREEGAKYTESWSTELQTVWNSAGIIKTPLEITGTLLEMTKLRGYSAELARLRDLKAKEHKMKCAKGLYFSRRRGGTSYAPGDTTYPHLTGTRSRLVRTMQGIIPVIEDYNSASNVHNITMANYTWDDFVDDVVVWFEYSNDNMTKWLFCGDAVMAFFSKIGTSGFIDGSVFKLNLNMNDKKLGIGVNTLETGLGTIRLVRDQMFSKGFNDTVGGVRPFTGWGVMVDPDNIQKVVFRPDKYQTGLAGNEYGGELLAEQYFSDFGIGITLAETHHLLKFS